MCCPVLAGDGVLNGLRGEIRLGVSGNIGKLIVFDVNLLSSNGSDRHGHCEESGGQTEPDADGSQVGPNHV